METFWFAALSFMIAMYVVLDGFDLGTGIIYLFAARDNSERRSMLNAIGPVWDGNEVWLISAGGTLFFAFPLLYASSFSGFYLPLTIVLWLLIGRALGIELRKHVDNALWRSFWDVIFSFSSLLLVVIFGAALGNIVRGVPIDANGYFFEPLWTTFTVVPESGILDWFTVLMALVAVFTLVVHGSNYIALKTEGAVNERARSISRKAIWGMLILSILAIISITAIRPEVWANYSRHYWGYVFPAAGFVSIIAMIYFRLKSSDFRAFLSSAVFIASMLASTAFGVYPSLLPSSIKPEYGLTVHNSKSGEYGMQLGVYWWAFGLVLALIYFAYLFYTFRGKVRVGEGEGY